MTLIERAHAIALSGQVRSLEQLRRRLHEEYFSYSELHELTGQALRSALEKQIFAATGGKKGGTAVRQNRPGRPRSPVSRRSIFERTVAGTPDEDSV